MCDEHFEEDLANYMRFPPLTRRQFAAASVGAGRRRDAAARG